MENHNLLWLVLLQLSGVCFLIAHLLSIKAKYSDRLIHPDLKALLIILTGLGCNPSEVPKGNTCQQVLIAEKDTASGKYVLLHEQEAYTKFFLAGLPEPGRIIFSSGEKGTQIISKQPDAQAPTYYLAGFGTDLENNRELFLRLELTETSEGLILEKKEQNYLLVSFCENTDCIMPPVQGSRPGPCWSKTDKKTRCIKTIIRYQYQWPE